MIGVRVARPLAHGAMCHGLVKCDVYGFVGVELLIGGGPDAWLE